MTSQEHDFAGAVTYVTDRMKEGVVLMELDTHYIGVVLTELERLKKIERRARPHPEEVRKAATFIREALQTDTANYQGTAVIPHKHLEIVLTELATVTADRDRLRDLHTAVGDNERVDPDSISDGYHTFGELYEHRTALFIALMFAYRRQAWYSPFHSDGTMFPGFFVAGMDLIIGETKQQVTYHLRVDPHWARLACLPIEIRPLAPEWDGHTPDNALSRLVSWTEMLGGDHATR